MCTYIAKMSSFFCNDGSTAKCAQAALKMHAWGCVPKDVCVYIGYHVLTLSLPLMRRPQQPSWQWSFPPYSSHASVHSSPLTQEWQDEGPHKRGGDGWHELRRRAPESAVMARVLFFANNIFIEICTRENTLLCSVWQKVSYNVHYKMSVHLVMESRLD